MLLSIKILRIYFFCIVLLTSIIIELSIAQPRINALDYLSIQEAIDQNPNRMIFIPSGEHRIDKALHFTTDQPARTAKVERGIIVSNNIFTDMEYGDENWRLQNKNLILNIFRFI